MRLYVSNLTRGNFATLFTVPPSVNYSFRALYVAKFTTLTISFSLYISQLPLQKLEVLVQQQGLENACKLNCIALLYDVTVKDRSFIFEVTHPVLLPENSSLIVTPGVYNDIVDTSFFANLWREL